MARLARWSLGLVLAFWLLLATVLGVLHGFIVPRISEYRPQLERLAGQTLGIPVRIGAVSAHSAGWMPVFELGEVTLLDAQGRPALQLPRVVAAVSARSLLRLGLEQLYVEAARLEVRRDAAGQLWIAGLPLPAPSAGPSPAADWLFSQTEIALRGGQLHWHDALRAAPPLSLYNVDLVLRNRGRRHQMRLDATPDSAWGARFMLAGQFQSPLLSTDAGNWRRWSGQAYADFAHLDVARLGQYLDLQGSSIAQGQGALRLWADVRRGQIEQLTTDLALNAVETRLRPDLTPLALQALQGRLRAERLPGGYAVHGQPLAFQTSDGLHWPASRFSVRHSRAEAAAVEAGPLGENGALHFEQLDLQIAAQLASRLPLNARVHAALQALAPRGQLKALHAEWRGPLDAPQQYTVQGEIEDLALAAQPGDDGPGVPGVQGLQAQFSLTQRGGTAQLQMAGGTLDLPGVFEERVLPLDHLSTELRWQIGPSDGAHDGSAALAVQARALRFGNADTQGEAEIHWRTGQDPATRFPGVLTLTGQLRDADGSRVHRYLPLEIPAETRHYVRDSVRAGRASRVNFKIDGDLDQLPFEQPGSGEFQIAAQVQDVTYAYVPASLQSAGETPWPALTQLSGELVFHRASMAVRKARARLVGHPRLQLQQIEARIPDLAHTRVAVSAQGRGDLADMLGFVAGSPVAGLTGHALDQAEADGTAALQLQLDLPINHIDQSKVNGSVTLHGNRVKLMPEVPALGQARGRVQFSDTGFTLAGVQAEALGGPVRLEGGWQTLPATAPATQSPLQLRASGTASATGLRQTPELDMLADLAQLAQGQTDYVLDLGLRRGIVEMSLASTLHGLALELPGPLGKPAAQAVPLRFARTLAPASLAAPTDSGKPPALEDEISLLWGDQGGFRYLRQLDDGTAAAHIPARVLRGVLALGTPGPLPPPPARGVHATLTADTLDIDAWQAALRRMLPAPAGPSEVRATTMGAAASYLPDTATLRAKRLVAEGRSLHDLNASGTRDGTRWNATLDARELSGRLEYHEGRSGDVAGQLHARLQRLTVARSAARDVDTLLTAQPRSLPALDIVVDALELYGHPLGRFEVQARNRAHPSGAGANEWQLDKFNITNPEARLQASGSWALSPRPPAQMRTALRFTLDIEDTGQLLTRFAMPGVVRNGRGQLQGQIAWDGSPLTPDYPSFSGQLHLDMASGQFLQADPGLAKLLGVLSLQALPRRLTLDFRDVFSQGFAFDFVRGDVQISQGVARTNNLQMKGVNAAVLMEGQADLLHETQQLHVVVVPEINAMTASLVATAVNPVVGLGSFLAQLLLRGPLIAANTQQFQIDGTWTDPQVRALTTPLPARAEEAQRPAPTADPLP